MNETLRCPKCGGEMKKGFLKGSGPYSTAEPVYVTNKKGVAWIRSGKVGSTYVLVCQKCGYIELYLEKNEAGIPDEFPKGEELPFERKEP